MASPDSSTLCSTARVYPQALAVPATVTISMPVQNHAHAGKLTAKASSPIKLAITAGSNRWYSWLPNTAEETSNPLPTLPWARQWTN